MRPPAGAEYVNEKMTVAISCLCGRGSLEERLADMTESALMRLEAHDLPAGKLREELEYVLAWTKGNWTGGREFRKLPSDVEFNLLVDRMLHILAQTSVSE